MAELDLNDLSLENIPSWPMPVKVGIMVVLFVLIIGAAYMLSFKMQWETLKSLEQKEISLKRKMEDKQHQAANLPQLKAQLAEMKRRFGKLLNQLPGKTEIPELLEDISLTGLQAGLKFQLFDPQPEIEHDFYVEVPIRITVDGNYHQIATFVSNIAGMRRIVTLHDFDIRFPKEQDKGKKPIRKVNGRWPLIMNVTAKVYRYQSLEE